MTAARDDTAPADPTPLPLKAADAPRAAWVMARAFTPWAVLAAVVVPLFVVVVLVYAVRGSAYLDPTRTGVVIIARHRPVLDGVFVVVVCFLLMVLGSVMGMAFGGGAGGTDWLEWLEWVAAGWLMLAVTIVVASSPGSVASHVGPETPRENLHTVMGLGQLPGTRLTALLLARRVVASLPAGTVVAACAATDELTGAYRRLGFLPGNGRRVYLRVGADGRAQASLDATQGTGVTE